MAVHIPLDIAYLRRIEDSSDRLDYVVPNAALRQVEQQLIAAKARLALGRLYRPIGVRAVEL